MSYAVGLDVGVTNVKVACVAPSGEVVAREQFETRSESADWPGRVRAHLAGIEQLRGRAGFVGLAAPGVARSDGVCIRWMQGRLSEVQGLDWGQFLGRRVPVVNDAQAALLGEVWLGAGRGQRNVVLLTLGTGVGGAAMVDGHLLRGWLGRAGHLGHICLDVDGHKDVTNVPGSLEELIGNYTIGRRSEGRFTTTHELIRAFREGDGEAERIWRRSVKALACGITSLINVLDPETVIIGGGISAAGDALFGPLGRELEGVTWSLEGERVRVVPAQLGEFAGAMGAAYQAIREGDRKSDA